MKYVIAVPDGATDQLSAYPDGRTPLHVADTPTMDMLANCSHVGWAKTVPDHLPPGSDVAFLSIFGYDPAKVYSGRAPLEAASMGIDLGEGIAFRCNLVTIEDGVMKEFTAGHISTDEARQLIESLNEAFDREPVRFHTGVQYRHAMTAPKNFGDVECTPPHDITNQAIESHLPKGESGAVILALMKRSREIYANHPVNQRRIEAGKPPATEIWLWGQGGKPQLPTYDQRCGLSGGVISAVDLIKGIGVLAGLDVIEVEGATGLPNTNYEGKAEAALEVLSVKDFVCVHVEGTDEMGHAGDEMAKTLAIRDFDQRMLKHLYEGLKAMGEDFRMLVLPDHPTPIALRTHVNEPVPYILFDSRDVAIRSDSGYSEHAIKSRTTQVIVGHQLLDVLSEGLELATVTPAAYTWD